MTKTENGEDSKPDHPEHRRKTVAGHFYDFLGSRVGLTLLAFFLTGVLGAAASWVAGELQRWQDQQSAVLQERARDLNLLHSGIDDAILQREIAIDELLSTYASNAPAPDVEQAWKAYLEASRSENVAAIESHSIVSGHTDDDPNPANESPARYFWYYLDTVIQGRFESLNRCLLAARSAYSGAGDAPEKKLQAARDTLRWCETDPGWEGQKYVYNRLDPRTQKTKTVSASVSEWDEFASCLNDYTYFLELSARLQRRVWENDQWSWAEFSKSSDRGSHAGDTCDEGDTVCAQNSFLRDLHTKLQISCGNSTEDYE